MIAAERLVTLSNKRAVSEVIGALIMITIAVVAGVIVYVYASGTLGSLQGSKMSPPYMERITLDYYQWNMTSKTVALILRNTGSTQITLADFFIAGNPITSVSFGTGCASVSLNVNAAGCQVILSYSSLTFTSGDAYNVRVVTADGAIFDFSCIAGATN